VANKHECASYILFGVRVCAWDETPTFIDNFVTCCFLAVTDYCISLSASICWYATAANIDK